MHIVVGVVSEDVEAQESGKQRSDELNKSQKALVSIKGTDAASKAALAA